jgi:DNA repair exonuclease SbcCD nuclease subunit
MDLSLLATSDLHLGMRFAAYPAVQERLSAARFAALERLVEIADREGCALLVVAGDLFHRLTLSPREIRSAAEILAGFQGSVAAILPGNHDFLAGPASPLWKSFRESLEAVKADRVLLLDRPQRFDLAPFGVPVHLYAAPCTSKHGHENAIGWVREQVPSAGPRDPEVLHLGVAHGSIEGLSPDAQGEYFPMKRGELQEAGLDLWVVGHTHRQHPERDDGAERILVPGTPEPDGFDCSHGGAAWLVRVTGDRQISRRSIPTGRYRFRRLELPLEEEVDPALLAGRFEAPEYTDTLLRLELRGRLSPERRRDVLEALAGLGEKLPWVEVDDSGLSELITRDTISGEFPQGSFGERLLSRLLEGEDQEGLQAAYDLLQEAKR